MSQDPNLPNEGEENYEAEGYQPSSGAFNPDQEDREDGISLGQAAPAVAAPQNRIVLILLIVVVVVVIAIFMLFSGKKGPTPEEIARAQANVPIAAQVTPPEPLPEPPAPTIPVTPEPEKTALPPLPLPPEEVLPPLPNQPASNTPAEDPSITAQKARQAEEFRQRRLRSNMTVSGGGGSSIANAVSGNNNARINSAEATSKDTNSQFEKNASSEPVQTVSAQKMPDSRTTIAQGKMVNVVLESALNTDLPAPIRAIVSRDTYAEAGKNILIPKGSRVIGRYNTDIFRGQKRIFIIWQRVIRPDGVSIAIGSPGVDQIGRAGTEGVVDNKYLEIYSSALLTSLITVGAAVGADKLVDGQVSTSNNALGGSTSTGTAGAQAVQQSITDLGETTRGVVQGVINLRPTITLDQGTRMNIFVNRDLTFPTSLNGGGAVVLQ